MPNKISKLDTHRAAFFKVGLIFSMSLVLAAFNYTIYPSTTAMAELEDPNIEKEIDITRTAREKPKPLPPPPSLETDVVLPPDPTTPEPKFIPKSIDLHKSGQDNISSLLKGSLTASAPVAPPTPPPPPRKKMKDIPFKVVERMPRFIKCDGTNKLEKEQCAQKALLEFVYKEIKYPAIAKEVSIEGTVVVNFVVKKDGTISEAKILKDIGGGCGAEVLRIIELMPKWEVPGAQRGEPVSVYYNLPVKFKLL